MGNTGSIHNLNTEGVSDLNSYYRTPRDRSSRIGGTHKFHQGLNESSLLRRNGEANAANINDSWSNSFPRPKHHASSAESPAPHVKVLPKLNDNLQLRSTANGAILQSGGTITGRRENNMTPASRTSLPLPPFGLMQRSHTLIYDRSEQQHDMFRSSINNQLTAAPVFRRVHTQLNMKYNHSEKKSDVLNDKPAKLAPMLSEPDLRLNHNVTASYKLNSPNQAPKQENIGNTNKATKVNKYNKKRKAPGVPSTAGTSNELKSKHVSSVSAHRADSDKNKINSSSKNQMATNLAASSALAHEAKTRLFRTKAETELSIVAGQRGKLALSTCSPKPQKPQTPQSHRAEELCSSMKKVISVSPKQQQRQPLLPYRREKCFDATLLRGREKEAIQQQDSSKHATTLQRLPTTDAPKATKIPQLKRTFYFGMETRRSSGSEFVKKPVNDMQNAQQAESASNVKKVVSTSTAKDLSSEKYQTSREDNNELASAGRNQEEDSNTSSSLSLTPLYDIGTSSKIYVDDSDDNGLNVHVRPTLPKRQLDIPRFSPAAAWRFLTERQQQVQLQRGSTKIRRTTQTPTATAVVVTQKGSINYTIDDKHDADNAMMDNSDKIPQKEAPIQPKCSVTPLLLNTKVTHVAPEPHVARDRPKGSTAKMCLAAWTPQQDLEEDDSSSDELQLMQSKLKGGIEDRTFMFGANRESNAKTSFPQNSFGCAAVHVFSLSLPREGNDMKTATAFNDKLQKSGFSSLQKLKQTVSGGNCGCIQSIYNDSNMMDHIFSSGTVTDQPLTTANVATDATNADVTNGIQGTTYRNDNWVLGKTKLSLTSKQSIFGAAGNEDLQPASGSATDKTRWDSLASMEPISLSHLTAGKHVMYLPHESNEQVTVNNHKPKIEQKSQEKLRKKRESHTRESLQDITPAASPPTSSTTVVVRKQNRDAVSTAIVSLLEKPQRFSFQSTVRLIEKRRLAEKLSKDAEIKEAQRRSELEAMKRVEEDFQRKRALEKASIRQQLRLVSSMEAMEQYQSLPAVVNINYRADPDGAVSSPSSSPLMHAVQDTERFVLGKTTDDVCHPQTSSKPVASRFNNHIEKDRERQRVHSLYRDRESSTDLDIDILEFQRTASLVEPYLQSIVK